MKPHLRIFTIALMFFYLFLFVSAIAQEKWKFNGVKEGIELYTKLDPNASFKTIKTVLTVDAPLSKIAWVLMDVNRTDEWVYAAKNCKTLKQYSATDLIYYSEVVVPPPFNNRDFAIRITLTQDKSTKQITVLADSKPDFLPEKPGLVRIHQSTGKWLISPMPNGLTRVEYILQVDPGGLIPAWVVNLFATKGPFESFKGLREQIKKKDYDGKKLAGIRD
jgi:hypothetical protein